MLEGESPCTCHDDGFKMREPKDIVPVNISATNMNEIVLVNKTVPENSPPMTFECMESGRAVKVKKTKYRIETVANL